eukprot:scaffold39477_cov15-Tisochrysis_lutea.AAC.1
MKQGSGIKETTKGARTTPSSMGHVTKVKMISDLMGLVLPGERRQQGPMTSSYGSNAGSLSPPAPLGNLPSMHPALWAGL